MVCLSLVCHYLDARQVCVLFLPLGFEFFLLVISMSLGGIIGPLREEVALDRVVLRVVNLSDVLLLVFDTRLGETNGGLSLKGATDHIFLLVVPVLLQ